MDEIFKIITDFSGMNDSEINDYITKLMKEYDKTKQKVANLISYLDLMDANYNVAREILEGKTKNE